MSTTTGTESSNELNEIRNETTVNEENSKGNITTDPAQLLKNDSESSGNNTIDEDGIKASQNSTNKDGKVEISTNETAEEAYKSINEDDDDASNNSTNSNEIVEALKNEALEEKSNEVSSAVMVNPTPALPAISGSLKSAEKKKVENSINSITSSHRKIQVLFSSNNGKSHRRHSKKSSNNGFKRWFET